VQESVILFFLEKTGAHEAGDPEKLGANGKTNEDQAHPQKGFLSGAGGSEFTDTTKPFDPEHHIFSPFYLSNDR